jgi:hypothetical protein
MKTLIALLLFSVSAVAQMTESALLQLDRDFAQATSEKRLDGWMKYMMDTTVIFGPPNSLSRLVGKFGITTRRRLRCPTSVCGGYQKARSCCHPVTLDTQSAPSNG